MTMTKKTLQSEARNKLLLVRVAGIQLLLVTTVKSGYFSCNSLGVDYTLVEDSEREGRKISRIDLNIERGATHSQVLPPPRIYTLREEIRIIAKL